MEPQLAASAIPVDHHAAIQSLVEQQSFTAADHIILTACVGEDELEQLVVAAKCDLPEGTCFLIDHAWSFLGADEALAGLAAMPQLLERVCDILGVSTDVDEAEPAEQGAMVAAMAPLAVLRGLAPLLGSYKAARPDGDVEEVFVMIDEVGCRIQAESEATEGAAPNCVVESLIDPQSGVGFCVACLTSAVAEGEPLLRAPSPFFAAQAGARLLGSLGAAAGGGEAPSDDAGAGAAEGKAEPEPDMSLPALRIGVMESISQNTHCSLIYKPFAKTARKIAIAAAARGYRPEYVQLSSADFPPNVVDNDEKVTAAARAISSRCEIVLGFCLGELMKWSKDGTYVVDEELTPRCRRVDDVLAVYGALEEPENGGVVMIPPASFQRFCFGKARYMRQLVACDVPIAPTLFIDRSAVIAAAGRAEAPEGNEQWSLAPRTSAMLEGCAVVAARVAAEVATARAGGWAALQPKPEPQGVESGSTMTLMDGRYFVKGDSGWCRNGNSEVKIDATTTAAAPTSGDESAAGQSEDARAARQATLHGDITTWGLAEQELFAAQLKSILYRQLVVDMASAVHLQPCITALTGRAEEFRGFVINGELVAVASTYFRRPGAVSYNLTDVQSEVLLIDHGLPEPTATLGGVKFSRIRAVIEAAALAIIELVGHVPVAIRTDCAVDPECGMVVLSEIEGGLDFSIFPQQVKSFVSAQSQELSITDRICELVADKVDEAAAELLERKRL